MTRTTALVLPLLLAAIASVVAGAWVVVQRDRARLFEQFAAERTRQVEETSRAVTSDMEDIAEDLRYATELLSAPGSTSDHERELNALLQVVAQYKAIGVYSDAGPAEIFIADPRAPAQARSPAALRALEETARQALAKSAGEMQTSPPLDDSAWLRAFAAPVHNDDGAAAPRRAVAVLVDLEPYFAALKLITTEEDAHLLLLGAYGRPAPASDPQLADAVRALDARRRELPQLANVLERMRQGERGMARLDEREAQALGLGAADVVAAFTPIAPRGGQAWSVATLTSVSALRELERAVTFRFALAASAVVLLLLTFGAYVLVASRREVALRESRRHANLLEHLHEKAQKTLDNIPTGVLSLSAEGRITSANQALLGRIGERALGGTLHDAFPNAPAPVVERLRALVDAACAEGRVRTLPGEALPLFGEPGQYSLHAVPLEHPDPDVRALLVVEDLSNVHALESQLLRAEKLATVGMLSAGIAHEIGTPLGVVRGRAEYLRARTGGDAPLQNGLGVIVEQIDRVSRTIRQLLDFARIQAPQVRPVDLTQQLRALQELLGVEAERRNVTLTAEVPATLPLLSADPDQLQQALVNLVVNAFDACEGGGTVAVRAEPEPGRGAALGGRVAIVVQDSGAGIPAERMNQVFDPFFTTKKRGQGTGLGLTIVAQIARNHGGEVAIDSAPGKGTRVTLLWPAHPSEERHAVS